VEKRRPGHSAVPGGTRGGSQAERRGGRGGRIPRTGFSIGNPPRPPQQMPRRSCRFAQAARSAG
jgi:hypothetical protein